MVFRRFQRVKLSSLYLKKIVNIYTIPLNTIACKLPISRHNWLPRTLIPGQVEMLPSRLPELPKPSIQDLGRKPKTLLLKPEHLKQNLGKSF